VTGLSVELCDLTKVFAGERGGNPDVPAVRGVNLAIHSGEFFTFLGPSGCGKTTTLRMIGGFEEPTRGEVFIQSRPMARVPPYRRPVNYVFQNYALFPHLTVGQNVAFGLAVKRVPRAERERRVREALEMVRLPGVSERKPAQLSGGQQQRVALARALINEPAVLLLDEPLGALDLKLRKEMQIELKHLQQRVGITFIYVTHDQEEALTISDRIAVMHDGEILQVGDPMAVYERPATRFVAEFIGESNFIAGEVAARNGETVQVAVGADRVLAALHGLNLAEGQPVTLTVRPEKLHLLRPEQANGNTLLGEVRERVYIGTDTRYVVGLPTGETVVARVQNHGGHSGGAFAVGDRVKVAWDAEDVRPLEG
jgi:spermidine/putrescine transport system ATP-binding protein